VWLPRHPNLPVEWGALVLSAESTKRLTWKQVQEGDNTFYHVLESRIAPPGDAACCASPASVHNPLVFWRASLPRLQEIICSHLQALQMPCVHLSLRQGISCLKVRGGI
jgi:hypothetical protein